MKSDLSVNLYDWIKIRLKLEFINHETNNTLFNTDFKIIKLIKLDLL